MLAPTPPQLRPSMTTSKLVCILILFIASGLVSVQGKRQKPKDDEIEIVANVTHSYIWKCPECPPGSGLIVQCGSSISIDIPIKCVPCVKGVNYSNTHDHSTCKSCRNCIKNENKIGKCTPEEDTTECLGTCYNGFYMHMDNNTRNCHPCSDCCNNKKIYHEEQCEDSGLPPNQQCRKSNITCLNSTKSTISQLPDTRNPDNEQGSQEALMIALIIIIAIFFVILLIVFLVLWRCYGWQKVKSFLRKWCCCCCRHGVPAEEIYSVNCHVSDQIFKGDSKAAPVGSVYSGSHLTEDGDVLTNPSSLSAHVPTEMPMIDYLPSMNVAKDSLPVQSASVGDGELTQICLQSVDVGVQNVDKERLDRPPVQDQGTSTTELHLLPAETLQAFQTRLLSETMSSIPLTFYRRICIKLDTLLQLSWNDFRLLAEKVGLDKDNILWLEQKDNPTKLILQEFQSQKDRSIGRFKAILEEMERDDVVTVIEEWIVDEWRKKNNDLSTSCSGKGPNNKLYSLV